MNNTNNNKYINNNNTYINSNELVMVIISNKS